MQPDLKICNSKAIMKINAKHKFMLTLSLSMLACRAFCHDVIVHMKITENAVASALAGSSAYKNNGFHEYGFI